MPKYEQYGPLAFPCEVVHACGKAEQGCYDASRWESNMSEISAGGAGTYRSGTSHSSPDALPIPPAAPSLPPSAVPFVGWNALAEVVEESHPGIAELMYGGALLMQAAIEDTYPFIWDRTLLWLEDSGVSQSRLDDLHDFLFGEWLPMTVDYLAGEISDTFSAMSDADRELVREDARSPLEDAAMTAFLERQPSLAEAYRHARDLLEANPSVHGAPRWWVTCSLEIPNVLGPGRESIYCSRPRRHADRVSVSERTYLSELDRSLEQTGVQRGYADPRWFRSTINEERVDGYWAHIAGTRSFGFSLHLDVGHRRKFFAQIAAALEENSPLIDESIRIALGTASTAAAAALATVAGPVSFAALPAMQIAASFARAFLERLQLWLTKTLGDSTLTTWVIYQTVIIDASGVPLTTFVLTRPDGGVADLHQAIDMGTGSVGADIRYRNEPEFHRKARFMVGESTAPYGLFDDGLWDVAALASPVTPISWTTATTDNSGFRLVLPHTSQECDARYASAVRAETRFEVDPYLGPGPVVKGGKHWKL